jgi:hypothetical protein
MGNKLTFREKLSWIILILLIGIMGGLLSFYSLNSLYPRGSSSIVEKVTEKQVYLEASSNMQAIEAFQPSVVNVFPRDDYEKFAAEDPDLSRDCFEKGLLCQNIALILTSDGLILYGGEWQEKQGKDLLAMDYEGKFYELEFGGKIKGFSLFHLVRRGELALKQEQRSGFYNLRAVSLGNLKISRAGQKILSVEAMIFGRIKVEEGIISGILNLSEGTVDFGEILRPVAVIFSNNLQGKQKFYLNLAGQIMSARAQDQSELSAEEITALLERISVNEKSLTVLNLGLRCVDLDKVLAQKLQMKVDYGCLITEGITSDGQVQEGGVLKGSLAEKSGLRSHDVIIEVDSESLLKGNLMDLVMKKAQGEKMELSVLRDQKLIKLTVQG